MKRPFEEVEEDDSEYEEDGENPKPVQGLPKVNAETLYIPLVYKRSEVNAYVDLIKNSPLSRGMSRLGLFWVDSSSYTLDSR